MHTRVGRAGRALQAVRHLRRRAAQERARSTPAAPSCITSRAASTACATQGVRFVNVTPTADDLDTGGAVEWLADPAQHRRRADPGALPHAAGREASTTATSSTAAPWASTSSRPISPARTPQWAEKITGIAGVAHRGAGARDGGDPHHGQHQLVAAAQPPRRAAVLGAGDARLHAGPDRPAGRRLRRAATARST